MNDKAEAAVTYYLAKHPTLIAIVVDKATLIIAHRAQPRMGKAASKPNATSGNCPVPGPVCN